MLNRLVAVLRLLTLFIVSCVAALIIFALAVTAEERWIVPVATIGYSHSMFLVGTLFGSALHIAVKPWLFPAR
jgi:hypothetical protein